MTDIFSLAMELGGAISGEHDLGRVVKVDLMRPIKHSFDPADILNPDVLFSDR